MKKIFFLVFIILLIPTNSILAVNDVVIDNQAKSDVKVVKDNNVLYYSTGDNFGVVFQHITVNNTYSYCLKFTDVIENTTDHKLEDPLSIFTPEQWNVFSLYAMYGERLFSQTNDVKYRYAAQALIHEMTNRNNAPMAFYDISNGKRSLFSVETYKQEIINLYNIHITLPNIDLGDTEFKVGDTYEFVDSSNVLSKYEVETSSEFADFSIVDNTLKISVKQQGVQEFSLVSSKYSHDGDILLWTSSKYQDLVAVSAFNPSREDYSFETRNKFGSLVINKRDSVTKELLSGAVFNLKKKSGEQFIDFGNYTVDKELRVDNLELGNYILEEVSAPTGYTKTSKVYEFEIVDDQQVVNLDIDNLKTLPTTGVKSIKKCLFLFSLVVFLVTTKKCLLK